MTETLLRVENLEKSYGLHKALGPVTFGLRRGERLALLGSNGAGKSTLFRLIAGQSAPEEGSVLLFGKDPRFFDARDKARLALIGDEPGLPPWAPVRELARLFRALYPAWDENRFDRLRTEWALPDRKTPDSMSKGQKRLSELALFLSCGAEILLLDEPFSGLDAVMRLRLFAELSRLREEGRTTLIYSTHILADVEKTADRFLILRAGRIVQDTPVAGLERPVEKIFREHYGL